MSNPWDEYKDDGPSPEDMQKMRYHMYLSNERESMVRSMVLVYRSRWLIVASIIFGVSGSVGSVVDFIAKTAGVGP